MNEMIRELREAGACLRVDFSPEILWDVFDFQVKTFDKVKGPREDYIFQRMNEYLENINTHFGGNGGGRWRGTHYD